MALETITMETSIKVPLGEMQEAMPKRYMVSKKRLGLNDNSTSRNGSGIPMSGDVLSCVSVSHSNAAPGYTLEVSNEAKPNYESLIASRTEIGFDVFYKSYAHALYSILYKIVLNASTAEDLLQDTFVKVWKNIDSYDRSRGAFFTWALNIARNTGIDYLRTKQYRNLRNTGPDSILLHYYVANESLGKEDLRGLKSTVEQLEHKYRVVINAIYFYGCSYYETARLLEIPIGTVKTRVRRALLLLKDRLHKMDAYCVSLSGSAQ